VSGATPGAVTTGWVERPRTWCTNTSPSPSSRVMKPASARMFFRHDRHAGSPNAHTSLGRAVRRAACASVPPPNASQPGSTYTARTYSAAADHNRRSAQAQLAAGCGATANPNAWRLVACSSASAHCAPGARQPSEQGIGTGHRAPCGHAPKPLATLNQFTLPGIFTSAMVACGGGAVS
jgi:hypothetical protein